jgi:ATP-dependent Clp protease ATP-binding subunit ClpX
MRPAHTERATSAGANIIRKRCQNCDYDVDRRRGIVASTRSTDHNKSTTFDHPRRFGRGHAKPSKVVREEGRRRSRRRANAPPEPGLRAGRHRPYPFHRGGAIDGLERSAEIARSAPASASAPGGASQLEATYDLLKSVEPEDLIKYGLIPEFVGRLPVLATLEELDEHALIQILTEPKNALIKQYQRLFHMEGVELEVRTGALGAVAKRALARKTGARGLRSILEQILLDTMYELPTLDNVSKVVVDESMVSADGKPLLIYSESQKVAGGSGA